MQLVKTTLEFVTKPYPVRPAVTTTMLLRIWLELSASSWMPYVIPDGWLPPSTRTLGPLAFAEAFRYLLSLPREVEDEIPFIVSCPAGAPARARGKRECPGGMQPLDLVKSVDVQK